MPLATRAIKKVMALTHRTGVFQAELFGDIAHAVSVSALAVAALELIITGSPHAAVLFAVGWKWVSFHQ